LFLSPYRSKKADLSPQGKITANASIRPKAKLNQKAKRLKALRKIEGNWRGAVTNGDGLKYWQFDSLQE